MQLLNLPVTTTDTLTTSEYVEVIDAAPIDDVRSNFKDLFALALSIEDAEGQDDGQ